MKAQFGLSEATRQKICTVFARYPQIERAVIYGSRAKGTYKNGSDIDLTLYGDDLSHEILLQILTEIDDLLLPYTMDLSIFHSIKDEDVTDHIMRIGRPFYVKRA